MISTTTSGRVQRYAHRWADTTARTGAWVRANPLLLGAILVGLAARVSYWVITDRRIDDALITIKHAKNVADGAGLTHHLGEGGPVHGFTSVLSALVPLPGELIASGGGLVMIRLVSLVAFIAAAVFAYRICRRLDLRTWAVALALGYLALDFNQIFYGVAGMETQIAVAVLLGGIWYLLDGRPRATGIALGLAVLARPDFILWVLAAAGFLLIRDRAALARALPWTLVPVLPWLIFATAYYGSPIPNPIVAKSLAFSPDLPSATDVTGWWDFLWDSLRAHSHDWTSLAPFREQASVVGAPVGDLVLKLVTWGVGLLALVGAASCRRRAPALLAAAAFVILWIAYKIALLTANYFDWYGVPVAAVIVLFAAIGLDRVTRMLSPAAVAVPAAVLVFAYAVHIPYTLPLEAAVQDKIEDGVRDPLGRYLGEVVKPGETIVTEPSGYFGYYTNATLLDYPGLTSTRVTDRLSEREIYPLVGLVVEFEPDWLALRPSERELLQQVYPESAAEYEVVRKFSVPEADSELVEGGVTEDNFDRSFIVLRRKASG